MRLFGRKQKPTQKDIMMDYFSNEYRDKLINEHRLVSASILTLTERFRAYAQDHGAEVTTHGVSELKTQKVILEAKIDVLKAFLDG